MNFTYPLQIIERLMVQLDGITNKILIADDDRVNRTILKKGPPNHPMILHS